ncbi:hypothetical protein [Runella slithyformis]|uniref:Uncharacterized protein n=1 Tax=Runella slithyformis (strain ATCC 29530 / DSM 19594 / LMG 11500 / NCIMB 11436 / LSU 4) TaxID=761193 RepID=A0A7U4E3Y2_RUNSL|nr:hypothetical protein [Runella slithyformis]AEI46901.1 hypothetical protein Runsl_0454 [Runella slithyformis DSM 19594]
MEIEYYERDGINFLTANAVAYLMEQKLIVEAPKGGLILGPSHNEGGVNVFRWENDEFPIVAEFEGWEYLANPFFTAQYSQQLEAINSEFDGTAPFTEYEIPSNIQLLDLRPNQQGLRKWLILGKAAQWIINRHSTQKHLDWLHKTNQEIWGSMVGS